jgi:dienelactone hydrolase
MKSRREFVQDAGRVMLSLAAPAKFAVAANKNVPWLAEVQRAPVPQPASSVGYFEALLAAADEKRITTVRDWERRRVEIRRRWLEFLGEMPERPPVRLTVLSEDRPGGCRRQLVRYESEPGLPVEGYLLRPEPLRKGRHAAVVALHQTSAENIDEVAGVKGPETQALGLKLVRQGYVVFCPRCFLWQGAKDYKEAVRTFQNRHPGTLGMHKMLYDAQRGIDVLSSLPEVDRRRIGAAGHSLGAKETLYLAAFDERIRAAVASEGGIGLDFTNWDDPWYLGSAIKDTGFKLNHHQLLALAAPRPFLIIAGESADGDRTWPFVEAVLPVFQLYGEPPRVGLFNHRQGHTIPGKAFDRLSEWLHTYLKA